MTGRWPTSTSSSACGRLAGNHYAVGADKDVQSRDVLVRQRQDVGLDCSDGAPMTPITTGFTVLLTADMNACSQT
jgi:hypothetical protein